jgi:hypothetical protein
MRRCSAICASAALRNLGHRIGHNAVANLLRELGYSLQSNRKTREGKWNRIEHRLFSLIMQNWRGKLLVSYQTIVQLIGATTTRTGMNRSAPSMTLAIRQV